MTDEWRLANIHTAMIRGARVGVIAFSVAFAANGQAVSPAIKLRTIAEVETQSVEAGHKIVRLVPADRVVPGDEVIYTLEIRNVGPTSLTAPTITIPVPAHTTYVADSATGPGAEVSYSADAGHTFDRAENLQVPGSDGKMRSANASDYTNIRWKFKKIMKSYSVAFARFRAVVK